MKTKKIIIAEENSGIVRKGFSGAYAELDYAPESSFIKFMNYKGKMRFSVEVENGAEYLIGPDFVKKLPPLAEDKYFPRRWGRENHRPHSSYFVKMLPGEFFRTEGLFSVGAGASIPCPEKLKHINIKPLNGFGYSHFLINMRWLDTVKNYEEFKAEAEAAYKKSQHFGG